MKYLMVLQQGAMDDVLYKDILDQEYVDEFQVSARDCNKLLYSIRRIHTSTYATKYFEPPFKSIWYKKDLLNRIDNNTCVVFQMAAMIHVGMSTLNSIKKNRTGAKVVLLLVDSIEAHSYSMQYAKRFIFGFKWDLILSFDKHDCEKYGFTYMGFSYYSKMNIQSDSTISSDLYYIGATKPGDNRISILNSIYEKCTDGKVKCDFNIVSQETSGIRNGITVLKRGIPYKEVLENVDTTNCILELVQTGQNNQTARYMEAVCYNKKLLTNNQYTVDLPYYDPRYIQVFSSTDDIDTDWIKEKVDVDFQYQDDFSPIKILDIIDEAFSRNTNEK